MSDGVVVGGQGAGLSQVERVVDTFIAPSKTFTDILRSTSWWLPFLLLVVVSLGATRLWSISRSDSSSVAENQIHQNPKAGRECNGFKTEAQKAAQMHGDGRSVIAHFEAMLSFCFHPDPLWRFGAGLLHGQLQLWARRANDV